MSNAMSTGIRIAIEIGIEIVPVIGNGGALQRRSRCDVEIPPPVRVGRLAVPLGGLDRRLDHAETVLTVDRCSPPGRAGFIRTLEASDY